MSEEHSITRRSFSKSCALGAAAMLTGFGPLGRRPFAAGLHAAGLGGPKKTRTLIAVFLRGGADALNMVVPYTDPNYYRVRPRIAIPPENRVGSRGVTVLDGVFGLHPGLESLKTLWDRKLFAPIVNTGSPHATRSHFDAQDFMEYAAPGNRTVKDGWLNRYLEGTKSRVQGDLLLRGLAMQRLLPRSLRGKYPVLAVPDAGRGEVERLLDVFDDVYQKRDAAKSGMTDGAGGAMQGEPAIEDDSASLDVGRSTIVALRRLFDAVDKDVDPKAANEAGYSKSSFGRQMQKIARIVKSDAGLEVACVDLAGFDHHIQEGGAAGDFQRKLKDIGDNIVAYANDLSDRFADSLIVVMSEFGRTVYENGNEGTDHGHGSCMLLAGGTVRGGKVYGRWNGLEDKNLYEGRDLTASTDFRAVFDEILTGHLGFEPPRDFFPRFERQKPSKFLTN